MIILFANKMKVNTTNSKVPNSLYSVVAIETKAQLANNRAQWLQAEQGWRKGHIPISCRKLNKTFCGQPSRFCSASYLRLQAGTRETPTALTSLVLPLLTKSWKVIFQHNCTWLLSSKNHETKENGCGRQHTYKQESDSTKSNWDTTLLCKPIRQNECWCLVGLLLGLKKQSRENLQFSKKPNYLSKYCVATKIWPRMAKTIKKLFRKRKTTVAWGHMCLLGSCWCIREGDDISSG